MNRLLSKRIAVLGMLASLGFLGSPRGLSQDALTPDVPELAPRPAIEAGSEAGAEVDIETEYQVLLEADDAAQAEVDRWIQDEQAFAKQGAASDPEVLNRRIISRLNAVRAAYQDFILRHPKHARIRLAYGSFLNDINETKGALEQLEMGRSLDPSNPAAWNNLANFYGHYGPVKKAFEYYQKAIELNSNEPVYYHNFGTTVFLFRKDAKEFYGFDEQQVFDRAMSLYRRARALAPTDFPLASDVAQTYYGMTPPRWEDALKAWEETMGLARDDVERQGVHIHLARIKMKLGRLDEARRHLDTIQDPMYSALKNRLQRNLNDQVQAPSVAAQEDVP